jgi:hypothetical protein
MRFVVFSIILMAAFFSRAQDVEVSHAKAPDTSQGDSLRAHYIQRFPDYFFIYPVLKQRSLSFELARTDKSASLTYKPNSTYSLGVGAYLFEVGIE